MASTSAALDSQSEDPLAFKVEEINFEYSIHWSLRWLGIAMHWLMAAPYAPFDVKLSPEDKKRLRRDNKQIQARTAGLSPDLVKSVYYHQKRVLTYELLVTPIIVLALIGSIYVLYSPFSSAVDRLVEALANLVFTPLTGQAWTALAIAVVIFVGVVISFLLMYLFLAGVAQRIMYVLFGKMYAPSLCANSVVMVNFFLLPDNALTNPEVRKKLLAHIRDLAQNTLLLPLCYRSTDAATQRKAFRHFKELESYVRERERWAIAPADTTLDDLRRDFKELASIYITGRYGLFRWQDAGGDEPAPPVSRWKGISAAVLRFVGFILPLGLIGAYLWQPELFPGVEVEKKVVVLIFIAWLLLALDVGLKLGVVGQLTSIAKGIKDLK
jgi:hypothetical protein